MKLRYRLDRKKIFYCVVTAIALVILLHPCRHAASYEYLHGGVGCKGGMIQYFLDPYHTEGTCILDNLNVGLSPNFTSSAAENCHYENIINDNTTLSISLVDGDLIEGHGIQEGGEYSPKECVPNFSTAIIVPYRDRVEQLRCFLVYMHKFFRHQKIHYRIFVIEQMDTLRFNRAKLLNIGANVAMKAGYPCLILHDVDLLPLRPANLYACTKQPRHMSANIDKNRFVLPYANYIGGVMSITSKQYKTVNGMSNGFFGWGGEDSNFYKRLKSHNIQVCRFDPAKNRYHHMSHNTPQEQLYHVSGETMKPLLMVYDDDDGLRTLRYTEVSTVLHPLFTHIMVDLHIM